MVIESLSLEHFITMITESFGSVILIIMIIESLSLEHFITMITQCFGKCNSYYNDYRILLGV